jgi:hypothetical protein
MELKGQDRRFERDPMSPLDKRGQQGIQRRQELRREMQDLKNMERLQRQREPLGRDHPRR